jgi:antitoxin MazE
MTVIPIAKWGNSSAIRLPKAVMEELGLKQGQKLQLTVKDGKGIIEAVPERPKTITLEWIIAEMKRLGPENAPETVEWASIPEEAIDDEYSRGEITLDDLLKGR